jgi:acylphosphatase
MSGAVRQVRVVYEGEVQGVGFRYVARKLANQLGVAGAWKISAMARCSWWRRGRRTC